MSSNPFKAALREGRTQIGLWVALGDPYAASLVGHAGFDWLVIDGEHGPNDVRSILTQLQALEASPSQAVVRAPMGEHWMLKQLLDIGAQNLLVPMVNTPEQARELVRAVRYPPAGNRGMGAGVARATRFNTRVRYTEEANDGICLMVQVETRQAVENIEAIAAVEGIDGIFVGPADLSADMGLPGRFELPEVQAAIDGAIKRIVATGKPAGIITFDEASNRHYLDLGATFVAVGADVTELTLALRRLRALYSDKGGEALPASASY